MATQILIHAVVFDQVGPVHDVLQVRKIPMPRPARDEVLVRVKASPIHPADRMFIAGAYRIQPKPAQVAGLEACGVVHSAEAGCQFKPGDRVAFRHPGCWAEFCTVPVQKLFAVPQEVGDDAACQFALNPLTAYGLLDVCGARAGDWIAVNAATSTVGSLVHDLAPLRGVNVVGIARRPPAMQGWIVEDTSDIELDLKRLSGGEGFTALLDSIGGEHISKLLGLLKAGASVVSYGALEAPPAQMSNSQMIYKNLTWSGFGIDHWLGQQGSKLELTVQTIWSAIIEKRLALPVHGRFDLSDINAALNAAEERPNRGKVILQPHALAHAPQPPTDGESSA